MLNFPANLTADRFLQGYWQKQPLFMRRGLHRLRPSISRNELGWLATLEEVESRLVFANDDSGRRQYYVESGPFTAEYLSRLPKRNWTLLVHDVEKHLPAMRRLLSHVPFIPDWRIDDVMVSFAAPGGGVGPHQDNYDVFLCQGIGVRNWRFTTADVAGDSDASNDLALLAEFDDGDDIDAVEGDVLYLPPGVPHWGIAKRACMTYSIGMRAPQAMDLAVLLNRKSAAASFYSDGDLGVDEAQPGLITRTAVHRAEKLMGLSPRHEADIGAALGRLVTQPKDWLCPEAPVGDEVEICFRRMCDGARTAVHGMALIAYDELNVYVNGCSCPLSTEDHKLVEAICRTRRFDPGISGAAEHPRLLRWMLQRGAFEIPETS